MSWRAPALNASLVDASALQAHHEVARHLGWQLSVRSAEQDAERVGLRSPPPHAFGDGAVMAVTVASNDQDASRRLCEPSCHAARHGFVPQHLCRVELLGLPAMSASMSPTMVEAHVDPEKAAVGIAAEVEIGQRCAYVRCQRRDAAPSDGATELTGGIERDQLNSSGCSGPQQRLVHLILEAPVMLPVGGASEIFAGEVTRPVVVQRRLMMAAEHLESQRHRPLIPFAFISEILHERVLRHVVGGLVVLLADAHHCGLGGRAQHRCGVAGLSVGACDFGSVQRRRHDGLRHAATDDEQHTQQERSHGREPTAFAVCAKTASSVAKRKKKEAPPPVEAFGDKLIARNKRASFDYELTERFEAGLVLVGSEVKMLRQGTADVTDAWVAIDGHEAWVKGLNIPEMQGTPWGHEAKRPRKLLLHKHQISQIKRAIERQGMTAVATRLYFRGGRVKLELALARGKRQADKRQSLKEREADREAQAAMARFKR